MGSKKTPLRRLRGKLWLAWMAKQGGGNVPETARKAAPRKNHEDGYSLWYKYARGDTCPDIQTIKEAEKHFKGSKDIFQNGICNLFLLIEAPNLRAAFRHLIKAVQENELMNDYACHGETTAAWVNNISYTLADRSETEPILSPLALAAGICTSRFLGDITPLTRVVEGALSQICRDYPQLYREDFVLADTEIAEAFEILKIGHHLENYVPEKHKSSPDETRMIDDMKAIGAGLMARAAAVKPAKM